MKQFPNKTIMKHFPNKTFLKHSGYRVIVLSCYRVIVLSLLHEGIPKQNHHEPHPKAINLTPKRLGSSTRQARPRMKGLQSEADDAPACKTTWRSLKHRNGAQHVICCLMQIFHSAIPKT
jgi:hypothetical protein